MLQRYSKKKKSRSLFLLKLFLSGVLFLFFLIVSIFIYFAKDLPDPEHIQDIERFESTKIFDRTGENILYEIYGEEKRTIIKIDDLPKYIAEATIAAEDNDFYKHHGIKFTSIIRAIITDIFHKSLAQGGSTITQQLIRNIILTKKKTFVRKIQEIVLSLELEQKYSKKEILEFYLNQIPYGSNAYGIEAASQTFFGKNAKNINLAEAALLAALPKAPSYYSPYGSHKNELLNRKNYILSKMLELGYISKEEFQTAKNQELNFKPPLTNIVAPHFVMYVKEYLEDKYGEDFLKIGGLKIITTLDFNLQKIAEGIVKEQAEINEKKYKAKNASLVSIDPKTGQILAMVGSRDYFDITNDGNVNVALQPRQPGSSFKPFVYATAFKKGLTPNTIVFDLETEFSTDSLISFKPKNYDEKTRGPVTLRQALAQSLNIPSVKVLYLAGINDSIDTAESMGITTLKPRERFGLALVLGGGEVKLLEETYAYGIFAQEGIKHPLSFILKIEDKNGKVLEEYKDNQIRVLDVEVARNINDILSDNEARAPIFGVDSYLKLADRPAAAKTGTTQNYRDAWLIGYTPSLVTGVWVGNNDNKEMTKGGAGISAAGPIWNKFMTEALKNQPVEYFTKPQEIITGKSILDGYFENSVNVKIDKLTSLLATEYTPPEYIEEKKYIEVHNILYYIDKNNILGDPPKSPESDPQFYNWEEPVLKWVNEQNAKYPDKKYNIPPPKEYDYIHTKENKPKITIIQPSQNLRVKTGDKINIKIAIESKYKIKQANFLLDDVLFLESDSVYPYEAVLTLPEDTKPGNHFIKIYVYDEFSNFNEDKLYFILE